MKNYLSTFIILVIVSVILLGFKVPDIDSFNFSNKSDVTAKKKIKNKLLPETYKVFPDSEFGFESDVKNSMENYIRLKNKWKNTYIHNQDGKLEDGEILPGWFSAMWTIEKVDPAYGDYVRIKNRWKGTYIHNQNGKLEDGEILPGWFSAMWTIEKVDPGYGDFVRLKNKWKGTYIHNQNGKLEDGEILPGWWSAMWAIVPVKTGLPEANVKTELPKAKDWVPTFYFDGSAQCYPDIPNPISDNVCRRFNEHAPVFWEGQKCGDNYRLAYWLWYGKQNPCDPINAGGGEHGNDWEHVILNFKNINSNYSLQSVTYYQHGGWYTRKYTTQPINVFIGKIGHGSYHTGCDGKAGDIVGIPIPPNPLDPGDCFGGCGYWDDFRNPGKKWIPTNIKPLSDAAKVAGQIGKRVSNEDYCGNLEKCKGSSNRLLSTSGCWQNNSTIFY